MDTRGEILVAARTAFASLGYEKTSLREVARRAGVDPALVHHYFEDKAALFVATMSLPADPRSIAASAHVSEGFDGALVVERFLSQWESPGTTGSSSFVAIVQATVASPQAADAIREFLAERLPEIGPPEEDEDHRRLRRSLVSSQLVGLGWARYVMRYEPLASMSRAEVARLVGPTVERYANGPLG